MRPIYICGPTASGKTALAIEIARRFHGEIVNADAFQLYRGLETLTAAPTEEERALAPHHLFGVLAPGEPCDAAAYRHLALPVIDEISSRGRLPVVVGGSGLYLKFLTHGPSDLPPGDPGLRRQLEKLEPPELHRRLAELDPVTAAGIDRHNPRYLQRALEICLLTGQPVSDLRQSFRSDPPGLRGLRLEVAPESLHARIEARSRLILGSDALAEVRSLRDLDGGAAKAIGVAEIRALLAGQCSSEECLRRLVVSTRRYAKRQRTWFRREGWLTPWPIPSNQSTDTDERLHELLAEDGGGGPV